MRDKKNLSGVLEKAVPKSRFFWHVINEKAGNTFWCLSLWEMQLMYL